MQRARRRDPYSWTWEIPLLVFMLVMLGLAVGVQVGRGLATLLAGSGWTWPTDQATFWRSLPAVATGDADAGLGPSVDGLASSKLLWACIGLVEAALLVAAGSVAVWCLRRWGPGRLRGMATRAEAERLLGVTRLQTVSSIVRPDLYGRHPARISGRGRGEPSVSVRAAANPANHPGNVADNGAGELGRGLSAGFRPDRFGRDDPDRADRRRS